jgi:hypothetical protein
MIASHWKLSKRIFHVISVLMVSKPWSSIQAAVSTINHIDQREP